MRSKHLQSLRIIEDPGNIPTKNIGDDAMMLYAAIYFPHAVALDSLRPETHKVESPPTGDFYETFRINWCVKTNRRKRRKKKENKKSDSRFGISRQETVIIPVPTALYYVCNADSMARNLL